MPFGFQRDGDADRLDRIEATLQQMFVNDRHAMELAGTTLFDGAAPHGVGPELRATDHKVNEAEREIRRELVVHASVHGGIDTPAILVYMSIVKDVERIGDYAKNLFDIAADGIAFTGATDADEQLRSIRDEILHMIDEVAAAFAERDHERARPLMERGDELLDIFDDHVSALVRGEEQHAKAVAAALTYRYLKRVVAHLMNVLSSVVMPIDRLDYFDEDPEDRD